MSKLPRMYYAPDPNYDYDSDTQAQYEDWKLCFDDSEREQFTRKELNEHDYPDEHGMYPSLNELKRRAAEARRQAEEIDYTVPNVCPFCREGNYCSCTNNDLRYNDPKNSNDPIDGFDDYCPDCGTNFDQRYYIAEDHAVCGCSPFYPDLRPIDYPNNSSCSCDLVKYVYLDETICNCNSPDLYALLERQHELNLTLNLVLILPNKSAHPFDEPIPFGN